MSAPIIKILIVLLSLNLLVAGTYWLSQESASDDTLTSASIEGSLDTEQSRNRDAAIVSSVAIQSTLNMSDSSESQTRLLEQIAATSEQYISTGSVLSEEQQLYLDQWLETHAGPEYLAQVEADLSLLLKQDNSELSVARTKAILARAEEVEKYLPTLEEPEDEAKNENK